MSGEKSFTAVSYTHLDVYKRQEIYLQEEFVSGSLACKHASMIPFAPLIILLHEKDIGSPVSFFV